MDNGRFQRAIGFVIIAAAAGAALLLCLAVAATDPAASRPPTQGVVFGAWHVIYDDQAPSLRALLAASGLALLMAAGVAVVERRIANRYRRTADQVLAPLAPKVVMAETAGVYAGEVTITVLIPAHNEEASLPATLASLQQQSLRPARVIVVADNCTDGTVDVARAAGVEVFESVGNADKKAGALNQALTVLLAQEGGARLDDNDIVMVMDADTVVSNGFLGGAAARFTEDRALMAVGGLFYGEAGGGLLGQFQRNEFHRYSREVSRRRGRPFVLTGTASLFRRRALRTIAASRGRSIPGRHGDVYDTTALTEDNELTIALKSLGAQVVSPSSCQVVTEVMPSWRTLWNQRLRWQRGALENLGAYGVLPQTFRYWAQQLSIGYGVVALFGYTLLIAITLLALEHWIWFPFWMGIGAVFIAERVVTVWRGGWAARLLAITLVPELLYATFLNIVFVKGVLDIALGRQAAWKHVVRPTDRLLAEAAA